jgi:hypothetical protein
MKKTLKSHDVINSISEKIELKKALRQARSDKDRKEIDKISKKITKIDQRLSSSPLSKS